MMKSKESGYMYKRIGRYEITIIKQEKKEPARLEKVEIEDDGTKIIRKLNNKINLALFILLIILFFIICYLLVPQTYGFVWY